MSIEFNAGDQPLPDDHALDVEGWAGYLQNERARYPALGFLTLAHLPNMSPALQMTYDLQLTTDVMRHTDDELERYMRVLSPGDLGRFDALMHCNSLCSIACQDPTTGRLGVLISAQDEMWPHPDRERCDTQGRPLMIWREGAAIYEHYKEWGERINEMTGAILDDFMAHDSDHPTSLESEYNGSLMEAINEIRGQMVQEAGQLRTFGPML